MRWPSQCCGNAGSNERLSSHMLTSRLLLFVTSPWIGVRMVQRTGMPCAVMFIELCGAAELFEALGNARAQVAVASQLHMLADTVDRHAGRTIKTIGPQIMCVFPTVRQAAATAVDAQHAARAAIQRQAAGALAVRVGIDPRLVTLDASSTPNRQRCRRRLDERRRERERHPAS